LSAHQILRMCGLDANHHGRWAYSHAVRYTAGTDTVFAIRCDSPRTARLIATILRRWTHDAVDDPSYNRALTTWMMHFSQKET
jgi:hypothetical protein